MLSSIDTESKSLCFRAVLPAGSWEGTQPSQLAQRDRRDIPCCVRLCSAIKPGGSLPGLLLLRGWLGINLLVMSSSVVCCSFSFSVSLCVSFSLLLFYFFSLVKLSLSEPPNCLTVTLLILSPVLLWGEQAAAWCVAVCWDKPQRWGRSLHVTGKKKKCNLNNGKANSV